MLDITYRPARSVDEALELAATHDQDSCYLAGGTDLIVLARMGRLTSSTWIDVSRVAELAGIQDREDHLWIGSGTTWAAIEASPLVRQRLPCLWQAAREVGSPQIRALGTIGGNFVNASPAGDGIPPLFALGACVVVAAAGGRRTVPSDTFFLGPRRTVLARGELVTGFEIPTWREARSAWLKLGPRRSLAISKVSVAMAVGIEDGVITKAQIGLGAVGPTVLRALTTEGFLAGKRPCRDVYEEACRLARGEVRPISDFRSTAEYRREVSGTLVKRVLQTLCGEPQDRRGGWDVELR